jgi:hypothetical protein
MNDNLSCFAVIAYSVHENSKIRIIYIELSDLNLRTVQNVM